MLKKKLAMKNVAVTVALLSAVAVSCLNENENDEVADVSTSVISYQQVAVPDTAVESYILQVFDWSLTGDGNSVFEHLTQDDYFGLQAVSNSAEPLRDLRFQLAKDLENGVNFLSLDGVFEPSQILTVKLPFSMFNLDGLFVASNEINLDDYDFFFQPADGSAQYAISASLAETSDSALVEAQAVGTFVVQLKNLCPDGTSSGANGNCADVASITGPDLNLRHYHDQDASLRTFDLPIDWQNKECAYSAAPPTSNWSSCPSNDKIELSAADFNLKQTIYVKGIDANGVARETSLDLSDSANGYDHVKFHVCSTGYIFNNDNSLDESVFGSLTNGLVICLRGASTLLSKSGPAVAAMTLGFEDLVIIGDHDGRARILNPHDDTNTARNSALVFTPDSHGVVVANLIIESRAKNYPIPTVILQENSSADWALYQPYAANGGGDVNRFTLSNVKIEYNPVGNLITYIPALKLEKGYDLKIYNSEIKTTKEKITNFSVYESIFSIEDSYFESLEVSIDVFTTEQMYDHPSSVSRSKIFMLNSTGCYTTIARHSSSNNQVVNFEDNHLIGGAHVLVTTAEMDGTWSRNQFERLDGCPNPNDVLNLGINTRLNGSGNVMCFNSGSGGVAWGNLWTVGMNSSGSLANNSINLPTCDANWVP